MWDRIAILLLAYVGKEMKERGGQTEAWYVAIALRSKEMTNEGSSREDNLQR